jgi:hypothetical protein
VSTPFPLEEEAQTDTRGEHLTDPNQPIPPGTFGGWGFQERDVPAGVSPGKLNSLALGAPLAYRGVSAVGSGIVGLENLLGAGAHGISAAFDTGNAGPVDQEIASGAKSIGKKIDADARDRLRALSPDPATSGAALQAMHGLVKVGTEALLGGTAGVGSAEGYNRYRDLKEQGVDTTTAAESAALTGIVNAAGLRVPMSFGSTLATRLASGAAAQTSFGMIDRKADAAILRAGGYDEMADQEHTFDMAQMAIDAVMGTAFGGLAHLHAPAVEHIDAALTANLALRNRKSAPGVATDPAAAGAHVDALNKAIQDLQDGKHVNVAGTGIEDAAFLARGGTENPELSEIIARELKDSGLLEHTEKLDMLEQALGRKLRGEEEPPAPKPESPLAVDPLDMKDFGLPKPPETLDPGHELLRPHWDPDKPDLQDMSPEREALRNDMVDERFKDAKPVPKGERPVAVVMGGGGASGKGTILRLLAARGFLPEGHVHLDPDEFKTGSEKKGWRGIPEYQHIMKAGDWRSATTTHEESGLLFKRARERATGGVDGKGKKYHVVLDRTLGDPEKAQAEIDALRKAGYAIHLVGTSVDPEAAIARAVKRAKRTNRWVPLTALLKAHKGFSQGFEGYASQVDSAQLYDNNVPEGTQPTLTAERKPGESALSILDREAYNSFERKASLNEQANTIRQISEAPATGGGGDETPGGPGRPPGVPENPRGAGGLEAGAAGTGRRGNGERALGPDSVSGERLETVSTASGRRIEVRPKIVEASDLVTSDHPEFPKALQPRQRGERAALDAQVRDIARNLEPERLGSSPEADRGAPIVSGKNEVESGNGRVMALRKVYEEETGNVAGPTKSKADLKSEFIGRDDAFWNIEPEDDEQGKPSEFRDNGYSGTQCTGYACAILHKLGPGRVKVFGFHDEDNPTSAIAQDAGGHDFAVVDGKYIVDPWLADLQGGAGEFKGESGVYDLKTDEAKVAKLYGDRELWKDMTATMPEGPKVKSAKADAYREFLKSQGHDISGFKQPVLVRERVTPMNQSERQAFTVEANQSATAAMSPVERGAADAKRLDGDTLARMTEGEVTSLGNQSFVRAFLEGLPVSERSALLNPDGSLSQEGVRRIQAAVLTKAFGGEPRSNQLLGRMLESTDADQRNILGALMDAAPAFARLRQMVEDGTIGPAFDITGKVLRAVEEAQAMRESGLSLKEFTGQTDMLNPRDPLVDTILKTFYDKAGKRAAGRPKVKAALMDYVDRATAQRLDQGNLFGDAPLAPDELLNATLAERKEDAAPASGDLFAKKETAEEPHPALDLATQAIEAKPNLEIVNEDGTVRAAGAKLAADTDAERTGSVAPGLFKSATDCFLRGAA